jgi:U3 small nucleolar RNA-associated protein 4
MLGVVAFDNAAPSELGSELPPLEVAIVERPIWDADLPLRYFGEREWER